MIFQVPGYLSKISTMSNYLRVQIDTLETLSPDAYKRLFELHNKSGWFTFNVHQIEAEDIIDLPPLKVKDGKKFTPSQRLRHVIFRIWQQDNSKLSEDDYYEWYMEKFTDKLKEKLT